MTNNHSPFIKPVIWCADSLRLKIREWPKNVREDAGHELYSLQCGEQPKNFRPMPTVGLGVNEIRIATKGEQYRLIYVAKFAEAVYVLHVITKKKTQQTSLLDLQLAKKRFKAILEGRKNQ